MDIFSPVFFHIKREIYSNSFVFFFWQVDFILFWWIKVMIVVQKFKLLNFLFEIGEYWLL